MLISRSLLLALGFVVSLLALGFLIWAIAMRQFALILPRRSQCLARMTPNRILGVRSIR